MVAAGRKRREIAALLDRAATGVDLGAPVAAEIGLARLGLDQGGRRQRGHDQELFHRNSPGPAAQCSSYRAPLTQTRGRPVPSIGRGNGGLSSIGGRAQPDHPGVSCTILPPTMVISAVVSASLSSATVSGSALGTTRSANLPGSREPFLASSNVR